MQIFGVDIGGSGIKGAPVDLDKGDLAQERLKVLTPHPSTPDSVAAWTCTTTDRPASSGMGVPSMVQICPLVA